MKSAFYLLALVFVFGACGTSNSASNSSKNASKTTNTTEKKFPEKKTNTISPTKK